MTKDVPDYCVVGGNPAKRIRDRFPAEVVQKLLASEWWMLPIEEVQLRMREFEEIIDQKP